MAAIEVTELASDLGKFYKALVGEGIPEATIHALVCEYNHQRLRVTQT